MYNEGVSDVSPAGIETLKDGGEGRRYLSSVDHFKGDNWPTGVVGIESLRPGGEGARHIQPEDHMLSEGVADPPVVLPIGGERKKHIYAEDHMLSCGTADTQRMKNEIEAGHGHGRRHMDCFFGPSPNSQGRAGEYHSSWKVDPSKLQGTSLLI